MVNSLLQNLHTNCFLGLETLQGTGGEEEDDEEEGAVVGGATVVCCSCTVRLASTASSVFGEGAPSPLDAEDEEISEEVPSKLWSLLTLGAGKGEDCAIAVEDEGITGWKAEDWLRRPKLGLRAGDCGKASGTSCCPGCW